MNTFSDPDGHRDGRLMAFGNQLTQTHIQLREELARLREELTSTVDGGAGDHSPGPPAPRELRFHCLAFCSALSTHHTEEDEGTFPALAGQYPELRPVLDQLTRDHHVVSAILRDVTELLGGLATDGGDPGPERLRGVAAELEGLEALLESHFRYEEKRLVEALNAWGAGQL